jgi:hypothetical protein
MRRGCAIMRMRLARLLPMSILVTTTALAQAPDSHQVFHRLGRFYGVVQIYRKQADGQFLFWRGASGPNPARDSQYP